MQQSLRMETTRETAGLYERVELAKDDAIHVATAEQQRIDRELGQAEAELAARFRELADGSVANVQLLKRLSDAFVDRRQIDGEIAQWQQSRDAVEALQRGVRAPASRGSGKQIVDQHLRTHFTPDLSFYEDRELWHSLSSPQQSRLLAKDKLLESILLDAAQGERTLALIQNMLYDNADEWVRVREGIEAQRVRLRGMVRRIGLEETRALDAPAQDSVRDATPPPRNAAGAAGATATAPPRSVPVATQNALLREYGPRPLRPGHSRHLPRNDLSEPAGGLYAEHKAFLAWRDRDASADTHGAEEEAAPPTPIPRGESPFELDGLDSEDGSYYYYSYSYEEEEFGLSDACTQTAAASVCDSWDVSSVGAHHRAEAGSEDDSDAPPPTATRSHSQKRSVNTHTVRRHIHQHDSSSSGEGGGTEPFTPEASFSKADRKRLLRGQAPKKHRRVVRKHREPPPPRTGSLPSFIRVVSMAAMGPVLPDVAPWLLQEGERDLDDLERGVTADEPRDMPRIAYFGTPPPRTPTAARSPAGSRPGSGSPRSRPHSQPQPQQQQQQQQTQTQTQAAAQAPAAAAPAAAPASAAAAPASAAAAAAASTQPVFRGSPYLTSPSPQPAPRPQQQPAPLVPALSVPAEQPKRVAPPPEAVPAVPPGWTAYWSEEHARYYFVHESGETVWKLPKRSGSSSKKRK